MKSALIAVCVALILSVNAFGQTETPVQALGNKGAQAAARAATNTLEPNEINTILWRRELMGRPGLQFYVVFFNDMGQPVDYFVTSGKCTSSNKRLLPPWKFERGQTGVTSKDASIYGDFVVPARDLDGTHGTSEHYVFCKTSDGKYKQWNGHYYLSDVPIEVTIKPVIIDSRGKIQNQQ